MILAKTSQCYDEKLEVIYSFLENTYWQNDVWHMEDEYFYESGIRERNAWSTEYKRITFTESNDAIKNEVKYIFAVQLTERILKLRSLISYGQYIHKLARFLKDKYPNVTSFYNLPYQKIMSV